MNYIERRRRKLDEERAQRKERERGRSKPQTNSIGCHEAIPKFRWNIEAIDSMGKAWWQR